MLLQRFVIRFNVSLCCPDLRKAIGLFLVKVVSFFLYRGTAQPHICVAKSNWTGQAQGSECVNDPCIKDGAPVCPSAPCRPSSLILLPCLYLRSQSPFVFVRCCPCIALYSACVLVWFKINYFIETGFSPGYLWTRVHLPSPHSSVNNPAITPGALTSP